MGFGEVMRLPIRSFWLLSDSINRISASEDMRSFRVEAMSQGTTEAIREFQESLVVEMGEVVKVDPIISAVRDQAGFNELKAML